MTRRFIIRPRAERDIQSVYDWYESQEPGLGEEFLKAVRKRLDAIRDFPESCPIIYRDVRPARSRIAISLPRLLCCATHSSLGSHCASFFAESGDLAAPLASGQVHVRGGRLLVPE